MKLLKRFLCFAGRMFRRGFLLGVACLAAVLAGYHLGRHSMPRFSPSAADGERAGVETVSSAPELNSDSAKSLSLRHRLALLLQNAGPDGTPAGGARLRVELHDLSENELRETMLIARDWPGGVRGLLYHEAAAALAWRNPVSAMAELLQQKPGTRRSIRIAEAMALWAKRDPEAAWKTWKENGLGKHSGTDGLESIIQECAKRNLSDAFAKLRSVEKDDVNRDQHGIEETVSGLCRELADGPQRETVLDELLASGNRVRGTGLHAVFEKSDFSDPAVLGEAQDWILRKGVTGKAADDIYSAMFAQRMKTEEPEGLVEWYQSVSGRYRPHLLGDIARGWAERDPNAAAEWLNRQEAGPELDTARLMMAESAMKTDLEAAFAWAASITDSRTRLMSIKNIWIRGSRDQSGEAVRAAIRNSGVSAEDQKTTRDAVWPWH